MSRTRALDRLQKAVSFAGDKASHHRQHQKQHDPAEDPGDHTPIAKEPGRDRIDPVKEEALSLDAEHPARVESDGQIERTRPQVGVRQDDTDEEQADEAGDQL